MISQSEAAGRGQTGAMPGSGVSDLMTERGSNTVADLLSRSGVSRGITEMLFPEIDEPGQEVPVQAAVVEPVETNNVEMETNLRIAAAREEAYNLAHGDFEAELTAKLVEERRRVDRVRLEFARDRQRFFSAAESQVVRLALAVASRVLSREVATDGMHLRATVKAALGRVQDSSATTLRVPVDEAEAWTAMFQRGSAGKVKVVGDERMSKGECVLETTVGRVELGVDVQMEEIERGFGELLQGQGIEAAGQESTGTR
jgi:flagellar assembly protein FliH